MFLKLINHQSKVAAHKPTEAAALDRTNPDNTIERPAHRATSFVPRLGKREPGARSASEAAALERILCAVGMDCDYADARRQAAIYSPMLAVIGTLARGMAADQESTVWQDSGALEQSNGLDNMMDMAQQEIKREVRALEETTGLQGNKRVAFTPRIGR